MLWKIQSLSCLWTDEGWFSLATRPRTSEILPRSLKKHGYASFGFGSNASYLTTVQHCAVSWEDYARLFFHTRCGSAVPSHSMCCHTVHVDVCILFKILWFHWTCNFLMWRSCHDKGRQWMWHFQGLYWWVHLVWRCLFGPVRSDVGSSSHHSSPSISIYKLQ